MTNILLKNLTTLPHRGATTACEKEAATLLEQYLNELGAIVPKEPFRTPRTYLTIVYWLIGGLMAGLLVASFSTESIMSWVAIFWVWTFIAMSWLYFNWRYSPVIHFPVQHTSYNVIGKWPAKKATQTYKVILMAHYDTAPVSALYTSKQVSGFRRSLIASLLIMVMAGTLATIDVAVGLTAFWQGAKAACMGYFVLQVALATVGYMMHGFTNGASDNATGVVAAVQTAERLSQLDLPDLEVEVVLTSAEEVGMIGAYYYVQQHKSEWNPTQTAVINFDTLGAGSLTIIEQTGTVEVIRYDNQLTRIACQVAKGADFANRVRVGRWHTADFDSVWFVRQHVPTLALTALDNNNQMPRIHRPEDKLGAVDETPIQAAVDLTEAVITEWIIAKNQESLINA